MIKINSFYELTPDHVLEAVEHAGYHPTGQYLQLNSYENRVFDIWLEEDNQVNSPSRIIAKFYRPQRWSREAILEEHSFLQELKAAEIPAVAPLGGTTTLTLEHDLWCGLFPRTIGRMPEELSLNDLTRIGSTLARIHNVGSQKVAKARPQLTAENFGWSSLQILKDWVSPEVWSRYQAAATDIVSYLEESLNPQDFIRIHGDCHKGNLLYSDRANENPEFSIVDFDDFCNGPVVQDFWMLLSGDPELENQELQALLQGYETFRDFNDEDLHLMLPLRGLRILHYGAWIARRWADPSFPRLFPQFRDYTYWAEETESLEKIAWKL
ncbi:MAG TPA: serine/threonine protein kinase [Pseudobdellovibrionaceae bacterium]|nr:serine/threonine protein kinase [Pseudobdellovibrionaceae bacterium]